MSEGHRQDQILAGLRDGLPRLWWALFDGAKLSGFTEAQAFALVTTFILAQNPTGIHPTSPPGDSSSNNE